MADNELTAEGGRLALAVHGYGVAGRALALAAAYAKERQTFGKAIIELGVVVAWPLLLWLVVSRIGAPAQISVV
mgnify:CR=1 FL=1